MIKKSLLAFPPGWVAVAAGGLAKGRLFPEAIPATGGLALLGMAGLGLGYRSARRHYYGTAHGKRRTRQPKVRLTTARTPLTLRSIPFVSEQTAAMTWAFLLSWWRQPQVRNSMIVTLVIGAGVFLVPMATKSDDAFATRALLPLLVIAWPLLSGGVYLFNAFGADTDGFHAMVLMPAPRKAYLQGANLGLFPFVGGVSVLFIALMAILVRPGWGLVLACILFTIQVFLLACTFGNFVTILLPYRFQWPGGGGRRKRGGGQALIPGLVALGSLSVALAPAAGCLILDFMLRDTLHLTRIPIAPLGGLASLILSILLYRALLPPAGRLLEKHEHRILNILHKDQE